MFAIFIVLLSHLVLRARHTVFLWLYDGVFSFQNNPNQNSAKGYVLPGKDHVTSSDNALYLYQVLPKYLIGFQSYGPGQ